MRLRYKDVACRTLTLIAWIAVAYGLYFHHIATLDTSSAESRAAEMVKKVLPVSDDNKSEWTTQEETTLTADKTTDSVQRYSTVSQPIKKSMQASISVRPSRTSIKSIAHKPIAGQPVAAKRIPSAPVKSIPVPVKPTKDPMDEYSDMGGIVIKHPNASTPINPHPFHYTLNPEKTCDVGNSTELFLLVYVHTRPDSIKQRELIRSTWGDVRNYNVTVRRIFVMGLPEGEYVQEAIKLESNLYHDIVQEDFFDTYRNLTYKAIGALRWVKNYCSNAKFVLKTDDDTFVSMHLLLDFLVSKYRAKLYGPRSLICNAWYSSAVARYGKWAVTVEQRKHPKWPNFCQGLAYIMTPKVAGDFYNASFDVPFLWMDDVYVTGFLARKIGMEHTQFGQHYVLEEQIVNRLKHSELWKNVFFSHVQDFDRSRWAWNRVVMLRNNPPTKTTGNPNFTTTASPKVVVPGKPKHSSTSAMKVVVPKKTLFLNTSVAKAAIPRKTHLPTMTSAKAVMSQKPPVNTANSSKAVALKKPNTPIHKATSAKIVMPRKPH